MTRPVPGIPGAAALGTLALTSGVALTATSGWLIVAASFRPQILTLLAAIVLVRAFGIARPALRYAERVRSHDAALGYLARRRESVYAALVPLTPARLGRRSRSDVLTGVVDDLDDLAFEQVRVIVPLASMVGTGLLAAGLVALVFVPAALVVVALVVGCLLLGVLGRRLETRAHTRLVAARAEVTRWARLVATSGADIAAIGGAPVVEAHLGRAQQELAEALRRQGRGRAVGIVGTPLLTIAAAAAVAALVLPWVRLGMPTPIAAMIVLVPIALGDVVGTVPDAVGALARAQAARRRLDALLDQRPAVAQAGQRGDGAAEAADDVLGARDDVLGDGLGVALGVRDDVAGATDDGLTAADPRRGGTLARPQGEARAGESLRTRALAARWAPGRPALAALDLDLAPGESLAVHGPNGCGKSTLLAVLARHLDPWSGEYLLGERDAVAMPLSEARGRSAVVDDETHVFASTLRENLRFTRPGATDDDVVRSLRLAGLRDWYEELPAGLDTMLGAGGQGLSGGERARLGIARAVLSARPLLLLDEPVAHLDHPTAVAVLADLADAAGGRTIVLVSHRDEAPPGARALRLDDPRETRESAGAEAATARR